MHSFGTIVFFRKFQVSQKLRVHASGTNVLATLGLLDAIGMCLLRVVMRASVL